MRIRCLEHANFEGPGNLAAWAEASGFEFQVEPLHEGRALPSLEDFDMLIVLGGPMSTKDEDKHAWLRKEKKLLAAAIDARKKVLGVCFGAQLVADVLGAKVYRNRGSEIGWFPIQLTPEGQRYAAFSSLTEELDVFHWHNDTFDIPKGAVHLASSAATRNQAFAYADNVLALQFHLEANGPTVTSLIENVEGRTSGHYVQSSEEMLDSQDKFSKLYLVCTEVLNAFAGKTSVSKAS